MWTAAILAGGQARRLGGRDKSALRIGARSILERQLAMLSALTPHLLIVGHHPSLPQPPLPTGVGVRLVEDQVKGAGALGGLYTALMEAPTEQVIVIACDMPFVSGPFLAAMAGFGAERDAAIPRDELGQHPLCASYQRRIAAHLRTHLDAGTRRISEALQGLDVRDIGPDDIAPFDPDRRLLTNVNTSDDYDRARFLAGRETPSA